MSFIAATLHPARGFGLEHAMKFYACAESKIGMEMSALGSYSIVDIHLFRLYWRLIRSLKLAPRTFPRLDAHYSRMMMRPVVQRTIEIEAAIGYELPG